MTCFDVTAVTGSMTKSICFAGDMNRAFAVYKQPKAGF